MHAQEILGVVDTHGVKEKENPPQTELFPANLDIERDKPHHLDIERDKPQHLDIDIERDIL